MFRSRPASEDPSLREGGSAGLAVRGHHQDTVHRMGRGGENPGATAGVGCPEVTGSEGARTRRSHRSWRCRGAHASHSTRSVRGGVAAPLPGGRLL